MSGDRALWVKQYRVAEEFFTRGFPKCGGPSTCSAACCQGGVYADVRERDAIMAHRDIIKKHMDETQTRDDTLWFEETEREDGDFPSGRCVGTREINNKCAFLDRNGHCTLQVAAVAEGMNRWALKPLFCVLYPVEITDRMIGFDGMLQGEHTCCSLARQFDVPLFEGCKEELVFLLGEDGYELIKRHHESLESSTARKP